MRIILLITLSIFSLTSMATEIDKRTSSALENINQGYFQYGFDELKKIAATNEIAAQYYVAFCYEYGIGVEKNSTEAFKMYRKAAERGLPDAMYHLAAYYRDGIVVSQSTSREQEWLHRYNQKGGALTLPDILVLYNEGLKYPERYTLNPNNSDNNPSNLLAQSNRDVNSNNQTINNITVVQQVPIVIDNQLEEDDLSLTEYDKSDVDLNIPIVQQELTNTFALIIANENYQEVENVPNALNDGKIFAEYCEKTIGIPKSNIRLLTDATLNNINRQISWICQVMDVYQGEANIIFYYAGHGIPDESNASSFLLPIDGYGSDVSTGYSLDKLYAELSSKSSKSVLVLLDACFSGAKRDGGMLASARGVAIKAKQNTPSGNMVVFSASQGDQTAYPYKEKGHGMFTYFLLKKLQETKGDVTLGDLSAYITDQVRKQSVISNGKLQTPNIIASPSMMNIWENLKLR